jgi:hypothetical protein
MIIHVHVFTIMIPIRQCTFIRSQIVFIVLNVIKGEIAMAGRSISIDEKIERQKEITFALKDKYEATVAELDALIQKKKELLKAI